MLSIVVDERRESSINAPFQGVHSVSGYNGPLPRWWHTVTSQDALAALKPHGGEERNTRLAIAMQGGIGSTLQKSRFHSGLRVFTDISRTYRLGPPAPDDTVAFDTRHWRA
jgi:hypothetical protein